MPRLLSGMFGGVIVGICEELGWTGFVVPRLRLHHNILTSGLILGVAWGAWHILSNDIWAIRTYSGTLSPTLYAIITGLGFLIGQLPPCRILMVWVYDRTGSLLIAMLMHASLTAP
jgi:membrane protease YdiL (CAAX protease family)